MIKIEENFVILLRNIQFVVIVGNIATYHTVKRGCYLSHSQFFLYICPTLTLLSSYSLFLHQYKLKKTKSTLRHTWMFQDISQTHNI